MSTEKWVYGFSEIGDAESSVDGAWDEVRGLLGGKGANLGEMNRLGVPVPAGFTVTTRACNAFLAAGEQFPGDMWEQVEQAVSSVEASTGKVFGDPGASLLVSCRSGAKFSMPGMMDTVLNIGLNDEVVAGLGEATGDARFANDSYRRLIQMFSSVVLRIPTEPFEGALTEARHRAGVGSDGELAASDLAKLVDEFKAIVVTRSGRPFPQSPLVQLRLATEAVFKSWNGRRAVAYRNASNIDHNLGTAVNIQGMVFGNRGKGSATGVAMSRNATTGEPGLEGDYLPNAQGEDVVAGIRATRPIAQMAEEMPEIYAEFAAIASRLEAHYRDMQDMEFTIESGKLWLLQTRDSKRTAQAAVRIAVDMVDEGLIDRTDAINRITPDQIDFFLHPQFAAESLGQARAEGALIASGLNVSPGAAVGVVAFDADLAEQWATADSKQVIMVRPETRPDDVHGMLAAEGILTSRGGRTSHAALVARQFGKPAVVGVADLEIDVPGRQMTVGENVIRQGDWISIDGTLGDVYLGALERVVPDISDPWLMKLLSWADEIRTLGVLANADYPADAERARHYGAEGIGLCRTEHMFFEAERLPIVQTMITTTNPVERQEALAALLPFQREDFAGLFRAMDGLPVIIRLIDPPLHEFLPAYDELTHDLADLKIRIMRASDLQTVDDLLIEVERKQHLLDRVVTLRETNPMLGYRGVRLGILLPELTRMQVRAIFEAACQVKREGVSVHPKIMIPLVSHERELDRQRSVLEAEAQEVMVEQEMEVDYAFGTMIETPRAALTAGDIARHAEFFSFGTNDLTQTTFGISRDDAETGFLVDYLKEGVLDANPFAELDEDGVGRLMRWTVAEGRAVRPDLEIGICGEHGGDPASIDMCHRLDLDYVSCSPFRVPVARLAAAQAALNNP